jgi:hypothetical protein
MTIDIHPSPSDEGLRGGVLLVILRDLKMLCRLHILHVD